MQLCIFRLGDEILGTDIEPVKEIIRVPNLVNVPLSPDSLLGLANLRGKVIPVLSLRRLFNMEDGKTNDSSRALVMDMGESVAIVVDQVLSIVSVGSDQIENAENGNGMISSEFLRGIVKDIGNYEIVAVIELDSVIRNRFEASNTKLNTLSSDLSELEKESEEKKEEGIEEERQIVCFSIGEEEYGFYIDSVQEIVQWPQKIIHVPDSPYYFLGIMRLRDNFVPLISLSRLLNISNEINDQSKIIVLNKAGKNFGVVVNRVSEVMRLPLSCLRDVPELMEKTDVISSICNIDNKRLISILSIDEIFKFDLKEAEEKMEELKKETDIEKNEISSDEENHMVVFKLGEEEYAVSINYVQEIVRISDDITSIPNAPDAVEGVMNLRGTVLPIVDLRQKMGMEKLERNERQRIVVFLMNGTKIGFIVDSVTEVMRLPKQYIEPIPAYTLGDHGFVDSIVNLTDQGRIIQILNPKKLISESEIQEIEEIQG